MPTATVVLLHGAFADASSFGDVVPRLLDDGIAVVAPAVPNRSLNGDAAAIGAVLATVPGPVVLVGHSYGCAVATVAGAAENVAGLVYLAGFVPAEGETLGELSGRYAEADLAQALVPLPLPQGGVDLTVATDRFPEIFAADVDPGIARVLAVSQRPLSASVFEEPASAAAWRTTPSWGVVATADRAINPDVERFGLERAGAETVEVDSSHLVMLARPDAVVDVITRAVRTVSA